MAKKAKKAVAKKKKVARRAAAPKRVQPVPVDVPQLAPYFTVSDGKRAIEFYKQVFGARERGQAMYGPDGTLAHCALKIGNALLMLAEPMGGPGQALPQGRSSGVMLYVRDADAVFEKAVSLGARALMPLQNMFWGDRWGLFEDPFGQLWQIATHLEDVRPADLARRAAQAMGQSAPQASAGIPPPPPDDVTTAEHVARA